MHPASGSHTPPHLADHTHQHINAHEHDRSGPVILTTSNVHGLSPSQAASVRDQTHNTTSSITSQHGAEAAEATAAAKKERERRGMGAYIETLKSKRAWDALVHGNMS